MSVTKQKSSNVILEKQWGGHRITIRKPYGKHRRPSYDYRSPLGDREQRSVPKDVDTKLKDLELWAEIFIDEKRKVFGTKPVKCTPVGKDSKGRSVWSIDSLFERFTHEKLPSYRRRQTRVDFQRAMVLFKHVIGGDTDARRLDQESIDKFVEARQRGLYLPLESGGRREYKPAHARYDLELLTQVFRYCMRLKLDDATWLLPAHPFERLMLLARANGKVKIVNSRSASHSIITLTRFRSQSSLQSHLRHIAPCLFEESTPHELARRLFPFRTVHTVTHEASIDQHARAHSMQLRGGYTGTGTSLSGTRTQYG